MISDNYIFIVDFSTQTPFLSYTFYEDLGDNVIWLPLFRDSPDEEVMGPNMNFSEVSTTMKCIISLTIQSAT